MPNYQSLVDQSVQAAGPAGGQVFVGQRDDAFFIDLGMTFDLINFRDSTTGNAGGFKDDLAGYAVHSFALKLPERAITRNGKSVNAARRLQRRGRRLGVHRAPKLVVTNGRGRGGIGRCVQVNRLGNPLINELFIPISRKDEFNRSRPPNDGKKFGEYALEPEMVKAINALFCLGCKETDRTDIVQALFTGIPGVTQIGDKPAAADTLKLNLGVPPTDTGPGQPLRRDRRRQRRPAKRPPAVRRHRRHLPAGGLRLPGSAEAQGGLKLPLGDGVDVNDKPFLGSFPYAAGPTSGFDSQLKAQQPTHAPTPGAPPLVP